MQHHHHFSPNTEQLFVGIQNDSSCLGSLLQVEPEPLVSVWTSCLGRDHQELIPQPPCGPLCSSPDAERLHINTMFIT